MYERWPTVSGASSAAPFSVVHDGGTNAFSEDHLGTIQKMTDANQAVVWEATYGPLGGASVTKQPFYDNPLRFPGKCCYGFSLKAQHLARPLSA